jgi:DNA-directed RNA polymerase specialized sigma subunit
MIDLEKEILHDVDVLVDRRREAKHVIDAIPDHRYRDILEMQYFHGAKWKRIMVDMHYASSSIFRLHGKALQEFDKMRVTDSSVLHILHIL